jgi:hypothetical protein
MAWSHGIRARIRKWQSEFGICIDCSGTLNTVV